MSVIEVTEFDRVSEQVTRVHLIYTYNTVETPWTFDWVIASPIADIKVKVDAKALELEALIDEDVAMLAQLKQDLE